MTDKTEIKPKGFFKFNKYDFIDFNPDNGLISFSGPNIVLTKEQSKQLFMSMLNHFRANNDKFWEQK